MYILRILTKKLKIIDEAVQWMLRDLGFFEQYLCTVCDSGKLDKWSNFKENYKEGFGYGVRPAILIDMSSFKITKVESVQRDVDAENKKKVKIIDKNRFGLYDYSYLLNCFYILCSLRKRYTEFFVFSKFNGEVV